MSSDQLSTEIRPTTVNYTVDNLLAFAGLKRRTGLKCPSVFIVRIAANLSCFLLHYDNRMKLGKSMRGFLRSEQLLSVPVRVLLTFNFNMMSHGLVWPQGLEWGIFLVAAGVYSIFHVVYRECQGRGLAVRYSYRG